MSTLNSTTTLRQIEAAYADKASYAEDNSEANAPAFVTASDLVCVAFTTRRSMRGGSGA